MKKLKQYFGYIAKSITDPQFIYKQRNKLDQAGRYFLFLMLTGSIIASSVLIGIGYKPLVNVYENLKQDTKDFSLQITDDGFEVKGVEMPYSFAVSTELNDEREGGAIYVDVRPDAEINVQELRKTYNNDMIIISQKNIDIYEKSAGLVQSVSTDDFDQELKGKNLVKLLVDRFDSFLSPKGIFTLGIILTLVLFIFGTIFQLLYIAVISAIMLLVSKKMKIAWTYKELYIVGMYAFTLSYLVNHVLPFNIPFVMSGVFIYMMYLVIKQKSDSTNK